MSNEEKLREYLKRSIADAHEVRERLREVEGRLSEPIAIVGMGCRFPGGVGSPEQLWRLVADEVDAVSEMPVDRGWPEDLFDPDPDAAGKSYAREGGFLYDAADFDASFFGISPREALAMDPQQRLLLETAWETIEHAGIDPTTLKGSHTGVFAGIVHYDYASRAGSAADDVEGSILTGTAASVLTGRVAYVLGLVGPAVSVDTACSSSLVALHQAVAALRSGECSMALAGGVAVMSTPGMFVEFSRQRGLAADGRCKSFSAGADGVGWSDGVGMLLLERLSDARRVGHEVLAVVRGSAVNQDGASNGLTAPNGPSQQRVIRAALANAGLHTGAVDVVEAHGTGTRLGDPIEAEALLATYGQDRPADRPLWLGSVKSNIGHSQAAAGVAGVIKMVMAMRHRRLPATLHVDAPSPHVDWSSGAVELLTTARAWDAEDDVPRRAAVSSFGISGTNAHVILEEAVETVTGIDDSDAAVDPERPLVWVVSAKSAAALRDQADRLLSHVRDRPALDPIGVGRALLDSRTSFDHRAVIIARERETLLAGLAQVAAGQDAGVVRDEAAGFGLAVGSPIGAGSGVGVVFSGQGSQRAGMGLGLCVYPAFASALDRVCAVLDPLLGVSLREVIASGAGLDDTGLAQPALFALEVALYELLVAWGVEPRVLVGHSVGEIAAAHVAGVLDLNDACVLVAARARLMQQLPAGGAMAAVTATEAEVRELLDEMFAESGAAPVIAAVNGPAAVVVSGASEVVARVVEVIEQRGGRARLLRVSHAFHSPLMAPMTEEFAAVLSGLTFHSARVPIVSTATGTLLDSQAWTDPHYWVNQIVFPVRFGDAIVVAAEQGIGGFVELGPDPSLTGAVTDTLAASHPELTVTAALRRDQSEPQYFVTSLAELSSAGASVNWRFSNEKAADNQPDAVAEVAVRRVELPTYAFQRKRFWLEARAGAGDAGALGVAAADHPLLGAVVELPAGGIMVTAKLSLRTHAWLADHQVAGVALLPGTGFVELLIAAGDRAGCTLLEELTVVTPLLLSPDPVQVRIAVGESDADGRCEASVHSRRETGASDGGEWQLHASAVLAIEPEMNSTPAGLGVWPPVDAVEVDLTDAYERVADHGYGYGPVFQGLRRVWRRGEEIFAEIGLPQEPGADAAAFLMHPALLDSALHAMLPAIGEQAGTAGLPFAWRGVRVYAAGAEHARVRIAPVAEGGVSVWLVDDHDSPISSVDALTMRPIPDNLLRVVTDSLYEVQWIAQSLSESAEGDRSRWVYLGDHDTDGFEGAGGRWLPDLAALTAELNAGGTAPAVVVMSPLPGHADLVVQGVYERLDAVLALLQAWLAEPRVEDSRLIVLTRNAAGIGGTSYTAAASEAGLVGASVWGLVRSAQSENPDRFVLVDTDGSPESWRALGAALDSGESQLVLRAGQATVPRLARVSVSPGLTIPQDRPWRVGAPEVGSLDSLRVVSDAVAEHAAAGGLGPGQVRVSVRAAGVNFRDVLMTLGMYPGEVALGSEGSGVVLEVGAGVTDFAAGDRVLGVFPDAFASVAVADARMLAPMPQGWSFEQAAAVPVVYLTAYYGLVDLAGLGAGESVLIHAGAGGVGMAAVQLARHLGAEVFATASPGKFGVLRELGVDDAHIASSRTTEFEAAFATVTGGRGVDVVLNSLAYEFLDASLRLTAAGGRFLDIGKADVRDPDRIAEQHDGVRYQAFDLMGSTGPERIGQMLVELLGLFRSGVLRVWPVRVWDVGQAGEAFRFMREGRHIGKNVLRVNGSSPVWDGEGTVLITGGSGTLGTMLARHVVTAHGVRHVLLVSRRGDSAEGFAELRGELLSAGAVSVTAAACDVADRAQLAEVLAGVDPEFPVRVVVHTAGVLDDGVITSLTPEQLRRVLAPKVDAAWNLHELTRDLDLRGFILYSSSAATFGAPGQGNYAAGNAFLDGLARYRHGLGLPATSLAWGLWEQSSGMTGHLQSGDRERMSRGGLVAMSEAEGHELLDRALAVPAPALVPARWDLNMLRSNGIGGIFAGLLATGPRRVAGGRTRSDRAGLGRRLASLSGEQRHRLLTEVIGGEVAAVLGYEPGSRIAEERAFKDLGFDSLTAVELRNRLTRLTGLRLPTTLIFDYPTVAELVTYVGTEISGAAAAPAPVATAVADDPIVIVGMGCRYPGGVGSPDQLWRMVSDEVDAVAGLPEDRGWPEDLFDPDPDAPGKSYSREGGFLYDAADFDASFFGISPREALSMDPQQRLLLETAWDTIEHAGIDPTSLRGTQTGVYVGAIAQDYGPRVGRGPADVEGLSLTGITLSVASGRVSYVLGLLGPAVTVDTACSSSLVALHQAVAALRAGECSMALAGGVTVMSTPGMFVEFSRQRVMSPDARCKSFSAAADGVGWAEGVGMLLLERLSDARRLGHEVLAVVRGSAVNQDGASNGLTAPNGPSQQRVIRAALANAGLPASAVDVVEAHGTGTRLGDPIEAEALLATYGQDRPADRPLWLGSVKSNIGHSQAAAGVAGVIKMVMAMRERRMPATLHVDAPSPHVDWASGAVELLTTARGWEAEADVPRRAAVSSFGISGTNAHVILEEAAPDPAVREGAETVTGSGRTDRPELPLVWVLSAKSAAALGDQADRLRSHVRDHPELDPADVGWSLAGSRTLFEHRAAIVGADRDTLLDGLDSLSRGQTGEHVISGSSTDEVHRVVFVFPGQGSQWLGMAQGMLRSSPVFTAALSECDRVLRPLVGWSVLEVLNAAEKETLERVDVVQPVLFAVMVSLAAVWRSLGVTPDAVVGHSQGEIAAAHVAGALSLADAALVVVRRSQLLVDLAGRGGMLSVPLPRDEVAAALTPWRGELSIAAVNGPRSTVVSGEIGSLNEYFDALESEGVRVRRIPVDYAAHSKQVEQISERLRHELRSVVPRSSTVPLWSTVTGGWLDTGEVDGEYWYRNLREPVEFEDAIRDLSASGHGVFVEVSAHPVVTIGIQETIDDAARDAVVTATLRRDRDELAEMMHAAAELFVAGVDVHWGEVFADLGVRRVHLPTYAFQRKRFWLESVTGRGDAGALGVEVAEHPLLGAVVELPSGGVVVTGRLSSRSHPWLADHRVANVALLPGTGFVELLMAAGDRVGCAVLEELTVVTPLLLSSDAVQVRVVVGEPDADGRCEASVYSRADAGEQGAEWMLHASAVMASELDLISTPVGLGEWPPIDAIEIDLTDAYERVAGYGYGYGPVFQGLRRAWRREDEVFAEVGLPSETGTAPGAFLVHPALLDSALHVMLPGIDVQAGPAGLPFAWRGVRVFATGAEHARVRIAPAPSGEGTDSRADGVSVALVDDRDVPIVTVDALSMRPIPENLLRGMVGGVADSLYELEWIAQSLPEPLAEDRSQWVFLGDHDIDGFEGIGGRWLPGLAALTAELDAGGIVPPDDVVLAPLDAVEVSESVVEGVYQRVDAVLALLQAWLAEPRVADSRLIVVTRNASGIGGTEAFSGSVDAVSGLADASVWGLVRSAQSENPDRFVLVDTDGSPESWQVLGAALDSGESQLVLRAGQATVPRLARVSTRSDGPAECVSPVWDGEGTVLITGGSGALGSMLARHVVATYGVRRVLLVSRRGESAADFVQLRGELIASGATSVLAAACDVADRAQLAAVLASVDPEFPVRVVVHTAGVLDDGVITSLTPEQLRRVLSPKVDAAWNLHELTRDLDLRGFILYSSVSGVLGSPGQGNYAAANAFLDGLAQYRYQSGLPATSLAWGLWEQPSGILEHLPTGDRQRIARSGLVAMSGTEGHELLDRALVLSAPTMVPARLDLKVLRDRGILGVFADLLSTGARRRGSHGAAEAAGWQRSLAGLAAPERVDLLTELIAIEVAAVLGHDDASDIASERAFKDLGFDSLTAVELRNRLSRRAAMRLPAALVFDYPTVSALACHIDDMLAQRGPSAGRAKSLSEEFEAFAASMLSEPLDSRERVDVIARLEDLMLRSRPGRDGDEPVGDDQAIAAASAEQLFSMIDDELESY